MYFIHVASLREFMIFFNGKDGKKYGERNKEYREEGGRTQRGGKKNRRIWNLD